MHTRRVKNAYNTGCIKRSDNVEFKKLTKREKKILFYTILAIIGMIAFGVFMHISTKG